MFKNYLKMAFRSLAKRKAFALINILGLAIGMAICLLILLFIQDESSFDNFHAQGDDIYRLVVKRQYPGRSTGYAIIPQSYASAVKQALPEVREAVRVFDFSGGVAFQLKYKDQPFEERRVLAVDSNFFRVFSADFIAGNKEDALLKTNSVVLNETTAKKYFGSTSQALGQLLQPEGPQAEPLQVTGVVKDWPENSHFQFDLLLTTVGRPGVYEENYVNFAAWTYLLLNKGVSPKSIDARFPAIIEKYAAGNIEKNFAQSFQQFQANGNGYTYYLQPLQQIHLISALENEYQPNGSQKAIYVFAIVAIFILLIACINFINLSTARSTERAKEVGIRKTFGSEKKSLIAQFLVESTLLSVLSMVIAVLMALVLLSFFNQVSGKHLRLADFFTRKNFLLLLSLTVFIGLVAGLYPAFVLSSFKPILVLKGKFKSNAYGLALRNGLVIFQFSTSVILIICTLVVSTQMKYMTSGGELGFRKQNTIIIERADLLDDKTSAFKIELQRLPDVVAASGASALPGQPNYFGISWALRGNQEPMTGRGIITDEDYQKTLGLTIKEGRFFSKDHPADSFAIVLNEKAVAELGLQTPIGTKLYAQEPFLNRENGETITYTVVGVLKDYHYQSLHSMITPLVFTNAARFHYQNQYLAVNVKADHFAASIKSIEQLWKSFVKDRPFHYSFLDKTVEQQYQAEQTTQKIFSFFSSLAIFIACIGLLGLAAYTTQQRIREIGIRKVLGASAFTIVRMLSIDFLKLVVAASLLAFPIAWWAMHTWLQDFAYRIGIGWWVFAIAALAAILVALATISFQAIKAATMSPIKNLRTE
ncbi:MAG TPA: ABC transporter permease [Flavihumibacter sp.]|mgnify:CR=1 FL=1|nr:ABC transporter permease [Flavihumibacter sp.]